MHSFWMRAQLSLGCALLCLLVSTLGSSAQQPATASPLAPSGSSAQYVGADTCKTCHEDVYTKHFEDTAHYALIKQGKHGCEDCHGPGSAHVEGGGDITKIISFKKLSTQEASQRCLSCHTYGNEHANFLRSVHFSNDIGCLSCHSPHHAKTDRKLLVEAQPQLCWQCHTEVKAEFNRPFRHRVKEGLIQCSDCHNPHGGYLAKQLRFTPRESSSFQWS